jgi:cell division protease FtsH
MIVGLLGGRAAEEIVFDTVTTGASNDIEKATSIARSMVTRYGMSKRFGLMGLETVESQYLEGRTSMNCADQTAAEVDNEVMGILKECYGEALGMLRENREVMDKIADHLIVKETITGKEFMKIYREAKGIPEPDDVKPAASEGVHIDVSTPNEETTVPVSLEKKESAPAPQEATDVKPVDEQVKSEETPIWQRSYEPSWQKTEENEPKAEPTAENNNSSDENSNGGSNNSNNSNDGDYSQFGSAWDQNVNGKR